MHIHQLEKLPNTKFQMNLRIFTLFSESATPKTLEYQIQSESTNCGANKLWTIILTRREFRKYNFILRIRDLQNTQLHVQIRVEKVCVFKGLRNFEIQMDVFESFFQFGNFKFRFNQGPAKLLSIKYEINSQVLETNSFWILFQIIGISTSDSESETPKAPVYSLF